MTIGWISRLAPHGSAAASWTRALLAALAARAPVTVWSEEDLSGLAIEGVVTRPLHGENIAWHELNRPDICLLTLEGDRGQSPALWGVATLPAVLILPDSGAASTPPGLGDLATPLSHALGILAHDLAFAASLREHTAAPVLHAPPAALADPDAYVELLLALAERAIAYRAGAASRLAIARAADEIALWWGGTAPPFEREFEEHLRAATPAGLEPLAEEQSRALRAAAARLLVAVESARKTRPPRL